MAIDTETKAILRTKISKERNKFFALRFVVGLIKVHGKHPVSSDGGTWYPQAFKFLKLKHHLHTPFERSIIERTMQYIKDRTTESFDDYFPCRVKD